jgi:hypothetical protein
LYSSRGHHPWPGGHHACWSSRSQVRRGMGRPFQPHGRPHCERRRHRLALLHLQ